MCSSHRASGDAFASASPAFRAALENYGRLHARILRADPTLRPDELKFLVWRPRGGLANRMLSIASTLLLAMLTDRALLVDWHDVNVHELFCEPFIAWDLAAYIANTRGALWPVLTMRTMRLFSDGDGAERAPALAEVIQCGDWNAAMPDLTIALSADQYFVPLMFKSPLFAAKLTAWFPDAQPARPLLHSLFRPVDPVLDEVARYTAAHLSDSDAFVLGVQIRTNPLHKLFARREDVLAHLQSGLDACLTAMALPAAKLEPSERHAAEGHSRQAGTPATRAASEATSAHAQLARGQVTPSGRRAEPPPGTDVRRVMPATRVTPVSPQSRVPLVEEPVLLRVVVASLHAEIKADMRGRFGPDASVPLYGDDVALTDSVDVASTRRALAELWLLSQSDHLIASPYSTFGYVASALGGVRTTLLALVSPPTVRMPCDEIAVIEPCFHMNASLRGSAPIAECQRVRVELPNAMFRPATQC